MSKILINFHSKTKKKTLKNRKDYLLVSEMFSDTLQGEGIYAGIPAVFLRLAGCPLACKWCDTKDMRYKGSIYFFEEIFEILEKNNVINNLKENHHLVLTGGSPLLQQIRLKKFLNDFEKKYHFHPFIEIENECVIKPQKELLYFVDCWNNSPKLFNSGNIKEHRYHSDVISFCSDLYNSWFKFVICNETDWDEIQRDFLDLGLIKKSQIILMPEGRTREEVIKNGFFVANLAIKEGVRYCSREQIILWNNKKSV